MAINQLSTANTFEQWLIATQILIEKSNYYEDTSNLLFDTANTISNTAIEVAANAAVVNSQTAIVLSTQANTYNIYLDTFEVYQNTLLYVEFVSNSYNVANVALSTAQNAANLIYEVFDDTANNVTLYPALFASNTGTPNTAFVSTTKLYYNPSTGQLSSTNFDSLSDFNKKKEIETIKHAVEMVSNLRGVTFKWKDNDQKSMGLIAQEVEPIVPEVVITNEFGDKSITYGSLVGLLVESIKELKTEIDEIKSIINK